MTGLTRAVSQGTDARSIETRVQLLLRSGNSEEAEALARSLLRGGIGSMHAWKLLASALRQQGRFEETREIQSMLVDKVPGDLATRFDLAETLLMLGEFERGWREYRYRYSLPHTVRIERKVQMPRWAGQSIMGQTLLIHDEQGFGDTFQFLRLIPQAKERSRARIILEMNPATLAFAQRMECADLTIPHGNLPPAFDFHCELMSLPMAMGLKIADLPGPMPYLKADAGRIDVWRDRLKDLPRPLVALTWAGRSTPNPHRSLPLTALAPLAMTGITFLSLQKGAQADEGKTPPAGMRFVNLSDEIVDFDDTAAVLSIADLLISIDSAAVHLAGALGRPAWVMLLHVADWRWSWRRQDSPWYPSLRLFRQHTPGDWAGVVKDIAIKLAALRAREVG
jgi:hypothetical protein